MYLANDVIQNSKKKGPEYGKEFGLVLTKAFKHISQYCTDDKTFKSLHRILNIWGERGVYDAATIKEFQTNLKNEKGNSTAATQEEAKKRKPEDSSDSAGSSSDTKKQKSSHTTSSSSSSKERVAAKERAKSESHEATNGKDVTLSPNESTGDPPEPEILIKLLQELDSSASSDAGVRQKIANLPPEVSEVALLSKLDDKESAQKLSGRVNEALKLLSEYNNRLAAEMAERKKLSVMLSDFQKEQQELLAETEKTLEVIFHFLNFYKSKESF